MAITRNEVGWFYESASDRRNSRNFSENTTSFGAYQKEGTKSFNEHFEELAEMYRESQGIDIK